MSLVCIQCLILTSFYSYIMSILTKGGVIIINLNWSVDEDKSAARAYYTHGGFVVGTAY